MDLKAKLKHYRISEQEYEMICERLGRPPQGVEWALFSALWSEHCSYKSTRVHLKKFATKSKRVLESFGENAGVIDLGEGERVAFKMESHNHPSYIEPYQGAATGVGGILRDIFTMGARPVALANYLCFGDPKAPRMAALVDGVVRGIGGYGNCVGVPTITGQTEFHPSYDGNILVNALAVGLFRPGDPISVSRAKGPGNYVVYVGAKTGRDGVHGASMASESFGEDAAAKKPTVQIGDPFFEKLLIESCLEVIKQGLVVAIQDMGAAGLTSSSFEMASKGGVGFRIDLDKVPLRDSSITPEEILLSESQERMLLICEPKRFSELKNVFERWGLDAAVIGEVIEEKQVILQWHKETLCAIDPDLLVENAPRYERPYKPWQPKNRSSSIQNLKISKSNQEGHALLIKYLGDHRGCSREWIFNQYDQRVGGQTASDCRESVGVVRLPDSQRGLGLVLGCRPYMMRFDAEEGAKDAVAYPALELAAKGFKPLATTDCLNFGNPEKIEVMSELVAAINGMAKMCEALDCPVISGNVSLYNETMGVNVSSTPSTGIVGIRSGVENLPRSTFVSAGDTLFLVACDQLILNGQAAEVENEGLAGQGSIDPDKTQRFLEAVLKVGESGLVKSSRVVGKFGLAYALARMCTKDLGAQVKVSSECLWEREGADPLFMESNYRVIFAVDKSHQDKFEKIWDAGCGKLFKLGEVGGSELIVNDLIKVSTETIDQVYHRSWQEKHFEALA